MLVSYSDSEGSDSEEVPKPTPASKPVTATKTSASNFTIDKSNPSKIRVNLTATLPAPSDREDGEPAAKRPRVGGSGPGAFSGFNAMLPAPKRDNAQPGSTSANGNKGAVRKVFSLKTGAEPAFSRDSDAELRDFFAEQEREQEQGTGSSGTIPDEIPKSQPPSIPTTTTGKAFMFKPLSVSRGPKKKKVASQIMKMPTTLAGQSVEAPGATNHTGVNSQNNLADQQPISQPKPKISLFSSGPSALPPDTDLEPDPHPDEDDEIIEVLDDPDPSNFSNGTHSQQRQPETLTSLADDLNLTAAERRQLLGRKNVAKGNIISFNTDTEYAANQELNASAEAAMQQQHNPVRAIGGGKHSLKSLVANAQGQKEALEESFATGRRNKKEAGGKYGW